MHHLAQVKSEAAPRLCPAAKHFHWGKAKQELGACGKLPVSSGRLGQEWGARSSLACPRLTHGHSFPLQPAKAASRQEPGLQGLCHAWQHQVLCKKTAKWSKTEVCHLQEERPGYSWCRKCEHPGQDGRQSHEVPTGGTSLCDNHPEECGREDFEEEGSEKWLIKIWTRTFLSLLPGKLACKLYWFKFLSAWSLSITGFCFNGGVQLWPMLVRLPLQGNFQIAIQTQFQLWKKQWFWLCFGLGSAVTWHYAHVSSKASPSKGKEPRMLHTQQQNPRSMVSAYL